MDMPKALAPVPRPTLAAYYDHHHFPPFPEDLFALYQHIRSVTSDLLIHPPPLPGDLKRLLEEASGGPVYEFDWNLWKNREHMEEILFFLGDSSSLSRPSTCEEGEISAIFYGIADKLKKPFDDLVSFQDKNCQLLFQTVFSRMTEVCKEGHIRHYEEQETTRKAKYDYIVHAGASIASRCDLLREQQMDWTKQLQTYCNNIIFRPASIEYNIRGVPKGVLDSLPLIRDDDWPMEELKERYGSQLYRLTAMILSIRLFLMLLWERFEARKLGKDQVIVLDKAVGVYASELQRFITFISEVYRGSPYFKRDEIQVIIVSEEEIHEVPLVVEETNMIIAWDFSLFLPGSFQCKSMLDVDFSVEHIDASGNKTIIVPRKRCVEDNGRMVAEEAGIYKFMWDNKYTSHNCKFVGFKVECTRPLVEYEKF